MPISVAQIDIWRAVPSESQQLEFKEARTRYDTNKLYRYCVAIANEGGGHLVLGIEDHPPRRVVGTQVINDPIGMAAKVFQAVGFRVDIEEVIHPDGRVVVLQIPSRPRGTAYEHEGAYLMRAGDQVVSMTEDRLRAIFAEGPPDWLSLAARHDCSDDDIVRWLDTQSYFDLQGLPYPAHRDQVLEKFHHEGLIRHVGGGWVITNLGAVLFAKQLDHFESAARKAPRVIVYEGKGKLSTKTDTPGTKGYAVGFQGLIEFINGVIPSNEVVERALRQQVKMFPAVAVREVVANALVHQDFNESGTSVLIEIYEDRMEVSSPGLPFVAPDRFIDSHQSRNETLAELMRRLRICEEKGSGIDKVVHASEVYQLPAPDFRAGERRTSVVLFAHQDLTQMDRNDRLRACYQHCCLRYVMNERMTNQSLRERFKLSDRQVATATTIITAALDAGKIKVADPAQTSTKYRSYVPFWA